MKKVSEPIVDLKTQIDNNEECEIEVIPVVEKNNNEDDLNSTLLNQRLRDLEIELNDRTDKIEKLESHADGLDYAVAAASGVLTGILDIFFVGEFSLDGTPWGTEKSEKFVVNIANKTAAKDSAIPKGHKFDSMPKAMEYLGNKYSANAASSVNHLSDFSFHPSILGLIVSIIGQLSGMTYGWNPKLGQFGWIAAANSSVAGASIFEKFFRAITTWGANLVCGISGAPNAKLGKGIPGPIMSMFQEGSSAITKTDSKAPIHFKNSLDDMFRGKLNGQNGVPFDFNSELAFYAHLGKQALVVGINEVIVRAFYFIRHLINEIKLEGVASFKELRKINWSNVVPFKNRTIVRMLTVSMATLTAIDTADAAIRAVARSGGNGAAFLTQFALRINYVGIGRTVIACTWDGIMGVRLAHNRNRRIELYNEYISLNNAKMFYKQGDLWQLADDVDKSINHTMDLVKQNEEYMKQCIVETKEDIKTISDDIEKADEHNEGLKDDIKDILKWGE